MCHWSYNIAVQLYISCICYNNQLSGFTYSIKRTRNAHSFSYTTGDMTDEEALLEWLIDNKDRGPASIIEEVDGKMLQNLVDTFEFLVVYFCE